MQNTKNTFRTFTIRIQALARTSRCLAINYLTTVPFWSRIAITTRFPWLLMSTSTTSRTAILRSRNPAKSLLRPARNLKVPRSRWFRTRVGLAQSNTLRIKTRKCEAVTMLRATKLARKSQSPSPGWEELKRVTCLLSKRSIPSVREGKDPSLIRSMHPSKRLPRFLALIYRSLKTAKNKLRDLKMKNRSKFTCSKALITFKIGFSQTPSTRFLKARSEKLVAHFQVIGESSIGLGCRFLARRGWGLTTIWSTTTLRFALSWKT